MVYLSTGNKVQLKELVINWHVTEACNFKCQYCYAKWSEDVNSREVIHRPDAVARLLQELAQFFAPGNASNPLRRNVVWRDIRLNIAGGEPLLYGHEVVSIAHQAKQLGFKVSIITNGSLLTVPLATELAPLLSMLGVSIDSVEQAANKMIGRLGRGDKYLDVDQLKATFEKVRRVNPSINLKVNTVVSSINHQDDMSEVLGALQPDKWKVFRMLPIITDRLTVNGSDFENFIARHKQYGLSISPEDNADMMQSYIMVDPHGRFFQNQSASKIYQYSRPIYEVGASKAFNEVRFSIEAYLRRYSVGGLS